MTSGAGVTKQPTSMRPPRLDAGFGGDGVERAGQRAEFLGLAQENPPDRRQGQAPRMVADGELDV